MSLKMKWSIFWRSLFLQACWNVERMQGLGFAFCLSPWLDRCHGAGTLARAKAQERHLVFFNTQPYAASLILGMVCAFEEEAASAPAEEREALLVRMNALKRGASSSLAGVADGLFWGALRPFCAALAVLVMYVLVGNEPFSSLYISVLLFLLAYNIPTLYARWVGLGVGYESKDRLAVRLKEVPWPALTRRLRAATGVLGLVLAPLGVMGLSPQERFLPALAIFAFVGLRWTPVRVSGVEAYAGVCAMGILAAAAGWL